EIWLTSTAHGAGIHPNGRPASYGQRRGRIRGKKKEGAEKYGPAEAHFCGMVPMSGLPRRRAVSHTRMDTRAIPCGTSTPVQQSAPRCRIDATRRTFPNNMRRASAVRACEEVSKMTKRQGPWLFGFGLGVLVVLGATLALSAMPSARAEAPAAVTYADPV